MGNNRSKNGSQSAPNSPIMVQNGPVNWKGFRSKFMLRASQYDFRQLTPNTAEFNENEPLKLTKRQRGLIVEGWRTYNEKGSNAAGVWIFKRIFSKNQEIKQLFRLQTVPLKHLEDSVRFQRHAQVFTNLLEIIVGSLEQQDDNLAPLLLYYGSKHAHIENRLGAELKQEFWLDFGKAMSDLSGNWKLEHHGKEATHSWGVLIQYVVKKIWEGYEIERERLIHVMHETDPYVKPCDAKRASVAR